MMRIIELTPLTDQVVNTCRGNSRAFLHEALLPAPDTGLRFASQAQDPIGAKTIRAQQDDLSPPDMLVWGVAIPREHLQTAAISGLESDGNSGAHAPDSHTYSPLGIPLGFKCQTRSTRQ